MTVKEVLELTINSLNSICIPVALVKPIGEAIATAAGNLQACIDALEKAEGGEGEKTDVT